VGSGLELPITSTSRSTANKRAYRSCRPELASDTGGSGLTYGDGIRHVRAVRMDAWIRGWAMFPIGPIRFYATRTEVLRLDPQPADWGSLEPDSVPPG
jgi:hypothetical protein